MKHLWSVMPVVLAMVIGTAQAGDAVVAPRSKSVSAVLREPLPPEELSDKVQGNEILITGPTFEYTVDRTTGAVVALQVEREGQPVIRLAEPTRLVIGRYDIASKENVGETTATLRSAEQVVLKTEGTLRTGRAAEPDLPYTLVSTFFNDGVVVCEITLRPPSDLAVEEIRHEVLATGVFRHYLHKTRDHHGIDSPWDVLPRAGESVTFSTLTSCLQVFSPKAGLAIFMDRGATQVAAGLDSAAVAVTGQEGDSTTVRLVQHIVNERPEGGGYRLRAHAPFTFRVGLSVVPNRLPHPRRHDLRMFVWIGDNSHPYPTDQEIHEAARLGYTLFQMHRVGTPGEPRPPAGELDRVIRTVHEAGMLFIWTANADLMYASAGGVREMQASGKWTLWQGFNYGGRYTADMDPYCDLVATCLASPNGLADYRLACDSTMMDRYQVDGMYIDDNLAYANCPLWKEHDHPQEVYDCLIELHEMNWRRRQLLRARSPHAVLIDHCSKATVLPVICSFDAHLYGEGYSVSTPERYWAQFGSLKNMDSQGFLWPGDDESERCATELAYNYDLLTGGGQYMYLDWRLYPEKFPYAAGVREEEPLFVRAYNLAQYNFGMYESTPFIFAESGDLFSTTMPLTYATIYRNDVWHDYLAVVANMNPDDRETSLAFRSPERLGLQQGGDYALLNVNDGKVDRVEGSELRKLGLARVRIPGQSLKLFYLRQQPGEGPYHLWGGKRISEEWDDEAGTLTLELQHPTGSEAVVLIASGDRPIGTVKVDGKRARFLVDSTQRVVHGKVRFGSDPVRVEIVRSASNQDRLPVGPVPPLPIPAR